MAIFVGQKLMKLLVKGGRMNPSARVGILGLSFKENVRDLRNSRIPEIAAELESFGVETMIFDPVADPAHARHEYGLDLCKREDLKDLDAIILAVPHDEFMADLKPYLATVQKGGFIIDVKSVINQSLVPEGVHYWSL